MAENMMTVLVRVSELAPIFDDVKDDDVAAEAIYLDHLRDKLTPLGLEIVDLELDDNPSGTILEWVLYPEGMP